MPAGPASGQRSALTVVLVSMPFMTAHHPSIQLGLLKSLADGHGFPARTLHANLDFALRIGMEYYELLCQHRGPMLGDWLFSLEAFPGTAPDPHARMIDDLASGLAHLGAHPDQVRERLLRIRDVDVPAYLDELVSTYPWQDAAVVGFSSTFQQNTASFALARHLKERHPHITTVFGGANFDDEMGPELVRAVDCIDVAVIGEADEAFPRLLSALAAGDGLEAVPGVARRLDGQVTVTPPAPPAVRLDDLPAPDYAEYFERAEDLGILPRVGHRNVWLPIETSRGCWWGAKHHCTFCGLNGTAMSFRPKSPGRVLDELTGQARRYRSFRFEAVDNIMDMTYLTTLFPLLTDNETGYEIFYEVKANLSREQIKMMAQAGITKIQPGIESLSSNVLRLMRKGVRASQNVNCLRWAQYYDIQADWNLLWGFAGETEQDYRDQETVIPHLRHLRPPSSAGRIWLERFSPLFTDPETFRLRRRTPERSYGYVYPGSVDLERVAYFFDYDLEGALPDSTYAGVRQAAADWSAAWETDKLPVLTYWSAPGFIQIYDERRQGQGGTYTFEDTLAGLYLACVSRPVTAAAVRRRLDLRLPAEAIWEIFEEFAKRGLMFLDGQFALALALPAVKGR
ncbi:MAG: RiPP maturation radical SAM C-methyltransferase [Actinobacteria bacterium]|nr:RiPP maturation radical SAM C-methyltransferase [Actinomycetota bacterium]